MFYHPIPQLRYYIKPIPAYEGVTFPTLERFRRQLEWEIRSATGQDSRVELLAGGVRVATYFKFN